MPTFRAEQLKTLTASIFHSLGAPLDDANLVSELLVEANLSGFDSHGVIRLPIYARGIKQGAVQPGAEITLVKETASTAILDGGWNFGQVVCQRAMNMCIEKAKRNVIGLVLARRCHHVGRLNVYAEMAMNQNMIGIVSVNSTSSVAPYGGKTRQLGTNPLCFAIPAGKEPPMILDMATSVWARGKVMVYLARGKELPEGVLFDEHGESTTDPTWYIRGGMLQPLGGLVGYKGFGLALLVEVLAGALTEAGCSNSDEYRSRPFYGGNGVFCMAININELTDLTQFKSRVDSLFNSIKASPAASSFTEILLPGDPERRIREQRLIDGIYVEDKTWNEITTLAQELDIAIPP